MSNLYAYRQLWDDEYEKLFIIPSAATKSNGLARNSCEYQDYNNQRLKKYALEDRSYRIKINLVKIAFFVSLVMLLINFK